MIINILPKLSFTTLTMSPFINFRKINSLDELLPYFRHAWISLLPLPLMTTFSMPYSSRMSMPLSTAFSFSSGVPLLFNIDSAKVVRLFLLFPSGLASLLVLYLSWFMSPPLDPRPAGAPYWPDCLSPP